MAKKETFEVKGEELLKKVVVAPVLAAVGAIAALISECTITVERN